jgi:uncharacterized protein (TIGR02391 family)
MADDWSLGSFLPEPAAAILEMEPHEAGQAILQFANARPRSGHGPLTAYTFGLDASRQGIPEELLDEARQILTEGWAWLVNHGLLIPDLADVNKGFILSRRGRDLAQTGDLAKFVAERSLRREELHARIADKPCSDFLRGDYSGAVFKAMREVEISVREAAKLANSFIGTKLMRKAFDLDDGPLTASGVEKSECQAMSDLFAGAIGLYKNPSSHRDVDVDPRMAAEVMTLASHLLRVVDDRAGVREKTD